VLLFPTPPHRPPVFLGEQKEFTYGYPSKGFISGRAQNDAPTPQETGNEGKLTAEENTSKGATPPESAHKQEPKLPAAPIASKGEGAAKEAEPAASSSHPKQSVPGGPSQNPNRSPSKSPSKSRCAVSAVQLTRRSRKDEQSEDLAFEGVAAKLRGKIDWSVQRQRVQFLNLATCFNWTTKKEAMREVIGTIPSERVALNKFSFCCCCRMFSRYFSRSSLWRGSLLTRQS